MAAVKVSRADELRRFITCSPFAALLVGCVCSIPGGYFWLLLAVVLFVLQYLRLYRVLTGTVLCAVITVLHGEWNARCAESLEHDLAQEGMVTLNGTVIRELRSGAILQDDSYGVDVAVRGDIPDWKTGDCVRLTACSRPVERPLVEGMFDSAEWMRGQGIAANLSLVQGEKTGRPFSWHVVRGMADGARNELAKRLMPAGMEESPACQVLCALVLGDKSHAEEETMQSFRFGGCLHAFAVSGLHVGMVFGLLWGMFFCLRVPVKTARYLVIFLLGAYVLMTGLAVPALRAYLMFVVLQGVVILERPLRMLNCWSFAAWLILMLAPNELYNAGFLLSFAVYAAICLGVRACMKDKPWFGVDDYKILRAYTKWDDRLILLELSVRCTVLVAFWAWLASLPIMLASFHTCNPYSFLTNIAITPVLPLVMGAGLLTLVLAPVPVLGTVCHWCAVQGASCLLGVVSFFGDMPAAYESAVRPPAGNAVMVMDLGYGGSCCMLGNPGLLIDCGSEATALFRTQPAVFHTGLRPVALLLSNDSTTRSGGAHVINSHWNEVEMIQAAHLEPGVHHYRSANGVFHIYTAPEGYRRTPLLNQCPIVLWEGPEQRVLYVGDAPASALHMLPTEVRRANLVILGYHDKDPVVDSRLLQEWGAERIILLPSAVNAPISEEMVAPARLIRMDAATPLWCNFELSSSPTLRQWYP